MRAMAANLAGAASSPSAATRNRPVQRLLNRMSATTSPCQLGALTDGLIGVAAHQRLAGPRTRGARPEGDQAARERADVVALHVQPRVDGRVGQTVDRRFVDEQIEGVQRRVGLGLAIAVEIGRGLAALVERRRPACARARAAPRWARTGSTPSGRSWRRPGPCRRAAGRSTACTCGRGRRTGCA